MRRAAALFIIVLALALGARAAAAQDAIDPTVVTVEGGAADVLTWPITSTFPAWTLSPGNMHTVYGKQGEWPAVDIGGGTLQEATVWIFLEIHGHWYGAGAERLRPHQTEKPEGPDVARIIPDDWLYDSHRWPDMAGHALTPGEVIGVMVAAGSTRSDHTVTVRERTPICEARFDGTTVALIPSPILPSSPTPPLPVPTPPAVTPPAPAPPPAPSPAPVAAVPVHVPWWQNKKMWAAIGAALAAIIAAVKA